jgi:hypothetical protein
MGGAEFGATGARAVRLRRRPVFQLDPEHRGQLIFGDALPATGRWRDTRQPWPA